ncbi:hypothetical protein EV424DRAFT_1598086 [Suillus variegatus]|nr:hypothetical protein EV424DRAFT_1598086 [Suillus variegatus]
MTKLTAVYGAGSVQKSKRPKFRVSLAYEISALMAGPAVKRTRTSCALMAVVLVLARVLGYLVKTKLKRCAKAAGGGGKGFVVGGGVVLDDEGRIQETDTAKSKLAKNSMRFSLTMPSDATMKARMCEIN